jgi:HSP20 family molecular chaperone IbpA
MKYYKNYGECNYEIHRKQKFKPVSVARDFDSLFNSLWNNWGIPSTKVPAVDIWENEKNYYLAAELPGYSEKDVDVHIDKHVLKISSLCEAGKEEKSGKNEPTS